MYTLEIGPAQIRMPIHKELLLSKSATVAMHSKLGEEFRLRENYLIEKHRSLQSTLKEEHFPDLRKILCSEDTALFPGSAEDLWTVLERIVDGDLEGKEVMHRLTDLKANDDLEGFKNIVESFLKSIEDQLLELRSTLKLREDGAFESAQDRYALPETKERIAEMLVHYLYSSRLEFMDWYGRFNELLPFDLVELFCVADLLQIPDLKTVIIKKAQSETFSTDLSTLSRKQREALMQVLKTSKVKDKSLEKLLDFLMELSGGMS